MKYSTVNCLIYLGLEVVFQIICSLNYTEMYIKHITPKMIIIYYSIKVRFGHAEETSQRDVSFTHTTYMYLDSY